MCTPCINQLFVKGYVYTLYQPTVCQRVCVHPVSTNCLSKGMSTPCINQLFVKGYVHTLYQPTVCQRVCVHPVSTNCLSKGMCTPCINQLFVKGYEYTLYQPTVCQRYVYTLYQPTVFQRVCVHPVSTNCLSKGMCTPCINQLFFKGYVHTLYELVCYNWNHTD